MSEPAHILHPTYAPDANPDEVVRDAGEALITAAIWLFCRNGIRNTGIEKIISRAGVSKMTLYNRFATKDGLVSAALEKEAEQWREWFFASVNAHVPDPRYGRLLFIFDALFVWFERKDYFGCLVMKAAIEFDDQSVEITRIFKIHKQEMDTYLTYLCEEAGFAGPGRIASMLTTIIDGCIVKALVSRNAHVALEAKDICKSILDVE
ncbi:TetR/AcrR family transcriptional regulator [Acetobacter persici]|uniref:TetR/AcrR family transcriptional regulator n=1 Tax=Acetobacter persici TaxID=1076596 RepID=UPI001BAC5D0E|nr:TetR/AcrR family transcriptional regulator [Acetobacter persici]MBS0964380.1 TetR/AcrR family transcriptional regulator [Acetobacter persici]